MDCIVLPVPRVEVRPPLKGIVRSSSKSSSRKLVKAVKKSSRTRLES